jgi:hypothetical protein
MRERSHLSSGAITLHVEEKWLLTGLDKVCGTLRSLWNGAKSGLRSEEASPAC